MLRDMVREFAEAEIAPVAAGYDESEQFPWASGKKMAELGLFGIPFPEEYGGAGMDLISATIVSEELARVDAGHSIMVGAHISLAGTPLYRWGTDEQKRKFLTPLASSEALGGFALTEPGSGSDASGMLTAAELKGDHYVINGQKTWITHGGVGELFILAAVTAPGEGNRGISAFIVTKETCDLELATSLGFGHSESLVPMPGFSTGQKLRKLGWNASDTRELVLEDVEVPVENRIGEENEGFKVFLDTLDGGRISIAAHALGIAQAALEASLRYTGERVQFGRPINKFQGIQFKLSDMATRIHAARLMTYHAAWLRQTGRPHKKEASMAKLFASEAAMEVTIDAVQLHGGYGYSREYPDRPRVVAGTRLLSVGSGVGAAPTVDLALGPRAGPAAALSISGQTR
jgi:butyryl-CoA dehydrogenase